ncbi:hypothetical protein ACQRIT_006523 [Beauveria bassiana]
MSQLILPASVPAAHPVIWSALPSSAQPPNVFNSLNSTCELQAPYTLSGAEFSKKVHLYTGSLSHLHSLS